MGPCKTLPKGTEAERMDESLWPLKASHADGTLSREAVVTTRKAHIIALLFLLRSAAAYRALFFSADTRASN